ncbi:LAS2 protein, partial [Amia calva]|nr:LAS2 protein [Amia calva]
MSADDSFHSPESTVTSLLASSGHLRSSYQREDASHSSIKYNDRQYESATEALDAYIEDFQKTLSTAEKTTGKLELHKDPISHVLSRPRFRNKDVLKERLSERELDFLNLPVGSSHHKEADLLSLTTDDLLFLPPDGSLPITRTSAFLTQSRCHPLGYSPRSRSYSDPRYIHRISEDLLDMVSHVKQKKKPEKKTEDTGFLGTESNYRTSRVKKHLSSLHSLPTPSEKTKHDTSSSKNYPRWLTSQKSEMDFSGITSIPDLKYPAWLKDCDIGCEPSSYKRAGRDIGSRLSQTQTPRALSKVPSWLDELEASYHDLQTNTDRYVRTANEMAQKGEHQGNRFGILRDEGGPGSLRRLREEFAEEMARRKDHSEEPFRDDKIELLIQKAENALASPSLGLGCAVREDGLSPRTEEVLDADRSWDNPPVHFKSPVPVGDTKGLNPNKTASTDLSDCIEAAGSSSSGYSSRKHPGPVEALKQMLFSLQTVEQRVSQESSEQQHQRAPSKIRKSAFVDYETAQGSQSLEKALHHLEKLKHLVDDMSEKSMKEEVALKEKHLEDVVNLNTS